MQPSPALDAPSHQAPTAGVARRLAAGCYDALLVGALWMAATLIIIAARGGEPVPAGTPAFQLLLLALASAYFIISWTRGGQTLGMRAWRLRVEARTGEAVTRLTAARRLAGGLITLASAGLGLFWLWIDRDELTWHDRLGGTRVVLLPRQGGRRPAGGAATGSG